MVEFTDEQIARFKILEQQDQRNITDSRKYRASEKGKINTANRRKYYQSKEGQEARTCYGYGYRTSEKGKIVHRESNRKWRLSRYGLSVEGYQELLTRQNGKCSICITELKKKPCVDHDHKTGVVRGLLCRNCNTILGQAKDSISILEATIQYLKRFENEE